MVGTIICEVIIIMCDIDGEILFIRNTIPTRVL